MGRLVGVILMAGLSTRFEGQNKQLSLLGGKPVFEYSINAFAQVEELEKLIVVVNKTNYDEINNYIKANNIEAEIILGGSTRQESVEKALEIIKLDNQDVVIIHDGARPLVDAEIIKMVAESAEENGACSVSLHAVDTIAMADEKNMVQHFVDRSKIVQIQTPQAFQYGVLKEAHMNAKDCLATDDCSLVLSIGHSVKLIEGSKKLHKITTKEDLQYLEGLLN